MIGTNSISCPAQPYMYARSQNDPVQSKKENAEMMLGILKQVVMVGPGDDANPIVRSGFAPEVIVLLPAKRCAMKGRCSSIECSAS